MQFDPSTRLYVIGDIHGRLDLLESMIKSIHLDAAQRSGPALTVTLGDYIDRGPKSRQVVERLAINPFPTPYVALKGNHEDLFMTFLGDPHSGQHWRSLGGLDTLLSFDPPAADLMRSREYGLAAQRLATVMTAQHGQFLASLRRSLTVGRYFLCHAGVRPGVPLNRQSEHDLMWIRREFLDSTASFGKIIVHGHTPVPVPDVLPNRINIDTGAFASGRLTCAVLEGDKHRFIQVSGHSRLRAAVRA
jgi:serine/threonine protein phosphatase 1